MATKQYQIDQKPTGETMLGSTTEIAAGNYTLINADGSIHRFKNGTEVTGPPRGTMRLSAPYTQTFTKSTWDTINFDEKGIERNGMVVNMSSKSILVPQDGWYNVVIGINAIFPGNDNFSVMVFVNGNPYSGNATNKSGEGSGDEVIINWVSAAYLNAGDTIYLKGQNAPTGSGNLPLDMKRLFFSVELDD